MQLKFRLLRKSLQYGLAWLGLVILMGSLAGLALAAAGDKIADAVLGQPNFKSAISNNGGISARSLASPSSVAIDPQSGRLYVADFINSRVLSWPSAAAFTNRQPADKVFGQPNFSSSTPNNGGISARSLNLPAGVAVDSRGNLYVADLSNNRVLQYNNPASQDTTADRVFGQPNFSSNTPNNGGIGAHSLADPLAVAADGQGNLYVADRGNNRVLEYNTPLSSDTQADRVFGQPNFTSSAPNSVGLNQSSLSGPAGMVIDSQGNLYVADQFNHRVLEYNTPLSSDAQADRVFGQPNFSSNTPNKGGVSARSLNQPGGVAVDSKGNLYVADSSNNRILEYNKPLSSDTKADRVFGQLNKFNTNVTNKGGLSAKSLRFPFGVAVDGLGHLYVADHVNHRVLRYDKPIGTVGVSELTPELGSSPAGQPTQFNLAWTIPATGTWRDLQHLDLRLVPTEAGPDATPLFWLRFNETDPASFSLLDANGVVLDSGLPGENRRLESEAVVLDLAASGFSHEGPGTPTLTLTLSLSFKPAAAGQVLDIETLASDDLGNAEGPEVVGVWEVHSVAGPEQHIYLPLILR